MESRVTNSATISQNIECNPLSRFHRQHLLTVLVLPRVVQKDLTQKVLSWTLTLQQGHRNAAVDTDGSHVLGVSSIEVTAEDVSSLR